MEKSHHQNISFSHLAQKYSSFIIDLDGLFFHNGKANHHFIKTLTSLKELGKKIYLITKNIKHPRSYFQTTLKEAGYEALLDEIYTPLHVSLSHIKIYYPKVKKLYVIGSEDMIKEVEGAGFTVVPCTEHGKLKISTEEELRNLDVDLTVDAVLLGFTFHYNYYMLSYASILINKGAHAFATTDEGSSKVGEKGLPGMGSLIASVEGVTLKQTKVIGNINADALSIILKSNSLNKDNCVLVGDKLDTDVLYGKNAGMQTCLILAEPHIKEALEKEKQKTDPILPNFVCKALSL